MKPRTLHVVLVLAVLLAPAMAQSTWSMIPTSGPIARLGHAMAYDSHRHRVVMFGGNGSSLALLNDTWEWDGLAWAEVSTAGPSGRVGHAMVYDSVRQRTVLFGGWQTPSPGVGVLLNDTWEWNGTSWTQVASSGPSARLGHAMAYDSQRGKTVLFGGSAATSYLGDTWEWDGITWTPVATVGPPARENHAMTFESGRGTTLLFGGLGAGTYGDTWEWDGQGWTLVAASGPSPRRSHAMTYVSDINRTVMYGGVMSGGSSGTIELRETWEWDGTAWTQSAVTVPLQHSGHRMVHDSARGLVFLFGGVAGSSLFPPQYLTGESWALLFGPNVGVSALATTYGTGCGTPLPSFAPAAGSRPLLGQAQRSDINNAAFGFAAVAWGLTSQSLPLDFVGINGCTLLNGAEMEVGSFCASTSFNTARHSLAIPFDATIIGLHVYLQAWTLAPAFNPVGVKMSNGVDLLIGDI